MNIKKILTLASVLCGAFLSVCKNEVFAADRNMELERRLFPDLFNVEDVLRYDNLREEQNVEQRIQDLEQILANENNFYDIEQMRKAVEIRDFLIREQARQMHNAEENNDEEVYLLLN